MGVQLGRPRAVAEEQYEQIKSLYNDGMTYQEISNKIGVSIATISRIIKSGE